MTTAHTQQIDDLFAREDWRTARALIEQEMKKRGDDPGHWLLDRLATTYYEERKYKKALSLLEKARALMPDCPMVLWDYAGTLDALGRSQEAIEVYIDLIHRGPESVGRDECGEGLEWAVGLLTDCFFRVSICLENLDRPKPALEFLLMYAQMVNAGVHSMYSESSNVVLKQFWKVLRKHPPGRLPRTAPMKMLKMFSKEAIQLLQAA